MHIAYVLNTVLYCFNMKKTDFPDLLKWHLKIFVNVCAALLSFYKFLEVSGNFEMIHSWLECFIGAFVTPN